MAMAKFVRGKPIMASYIPASSYSAGDVLVIGGLPVVAHEDNPPFGTTVITDAFAASGGIYEMTADGAIPVGSRVYWDASASKVTLTPGTNTLFGFLVQGPTLVASDPGPATSGDKCQVLHHPVGSGAGAIFAPYAITAAGAVQANAANLNYGFNLVGSADGTTGVILPTPQPGRTLIVKNNAASTLKLYPQTAGTINLLSANTNYALLTNTACMFIPYSNVAWYTLPLVAS